MTPTPIGRIAAATRAVGASSYLLTGLGPADRPTGFIILASDAEPPRWPAESTLITLASELTRAMEHAELLAEVDRRLEHERRLASRLDSLIEVGRLEADADVNTVARGLIDRLVDSVGAAAGIVGVERDGQFAPLADRGAVDRMPGLVGRAVEEFRAWQRFELGEGAFLQRYVEGEVSARMLAESTQAGLTAYAAFPIRSAGRLLGVVALFFEQPVDQLTIDARTLEAIGRGVSIAFDNQRLRERLVASEVRYRTLFEASPEAFFVATRDGLVLTANDAATTMFRGRADSLPGMRVMDVLPMEPSVLRRQADELERTGRARGTQRGQAARRGRLPGVRDHPARDGGR